MLEDLLPFVLIITVAIIFSPIYFLRRKTARMADDDLKRIDREDWEKQKKFGAYTRLISRVVWGGILAIIGFLNIRVYDEWSARLLVVYIVSGVLLIIWGLLGFRRELVEIGALK